MISHTCQSRTEGQPKAEWLGRIPGVDLCVLSPVRWRHYGRWRAADPPPDGASFHYEAGRVRLPWAGPGQFYLHHYPELKRILREFRPQVIDLWEEPWAAVSAQAVRLRDRLLPATKVISETEQNINRTLPPPFEQFRRYVLRRADFVVGRSAEALQVVRARGFRGPGEAVPNGVDTDLFRPMDRAACRAALQLDGFLVGYVGRLVPEKGLTDLVRALPLSPPWVKVLVIGQGPMQDELQRLASEPQFAGRLHLLGARSLEQLPTLMNALDVLVLPSRTTAHWKEQFGRVLIEANACGTPVIGSDSGAIPDVIGAGGLVFSEGDPVGIASAIKQLAENPEHASKMGVAGREAAVEKYSWQQVANRMHAIYQRVFEKRVLT